MTTAKSPKLGLMGYSFITVPRVDRTEVVYHKNGRIVLNGANARAEVWAKEKAIVHEILEDFVMAMEDNVDPRFAIKLLEPIEAGEISRDPSDSDWAYSRIPLDQIPVLKLADKQWEKAMVEMKEFEQAPW